MPTGRTAHCACAHGHEQAFVSPTSMCLPQPTASAHGEVPVPKYIHGSGEGVKRAESDVAVWPMAATRWLRCVHVVVPRSFSAANCGRDAPLCPTALAAL